MHSFPIGQFRSATKLVLLAAAALSVCAGIAESEPNNTFSTANTIVLDSAFRGGVSTARIYPRTDPDLYRVSIPTLPGPLSLRIVMTPIGTDRELDATFRVLSGAGAQVGYKNDIGNNGVEILDTPVQGGATYYVECGSADWSISGTGEYLLGIALFVPPTIQPVYWSTPNRTLTCFDGTPVTLNAQLAGFTVGDVVTFKVYEDDFLSDDLIESAQATVFSIGSTFYATANWTAKWVPDGVGDPEFYFTVAGRDVSANSPLLNVRQGDGDDQLVEAVPLGAVTASTEKPDAVTLPEDADLFSVQISAGQRVTFDVDRLAGSSLAPTLRLFASNGSELAKNTGGAAPLELPGGGAFIERTFPAGGTFYVGVSGAGNTNYSVKTGAGDLPGSTGAYRLTVSPGIAGHVQKPGSSTEYLVDFLRADKPGALVDSLKTTWVVVHGWNSSRNKANIAELVRALATARPNDQVLTLDWSAIAETGWIDLLDPFGPVRSAASGIVPVATWAAGALQNAGIFGHQLNLVGHSFGSYVADEIAKRYPGKVNSIVALDPAANVVPGVYDPESNNTVDFRRDAQWSWAFHSSSLGNEYTPARAHEAFIVDSGINALDAHSAVVGLFAYMIMHPNDPISALLGLDDLLDMAYGPWVLDQYVSNFPGFLIFGADDPVLGYEAIITDPDGKTPVKLDYLVNAPRVWIDSPSTGAAATQSPVVIRGRATDAGSGNSGIVSVLVNGKRAAGDTAGSTNTANWTATVPLKLGTNRITVVATDGSQPNVGATTNWISVAYNPPVIGMPDLLLNEGQTLVANLAVNDGELADKPLTYVFGIGPAGMSLSPAGVLEWNPTEAQGPSTNLVEVGVSDGVSGTRKRFSVVVREVNSAPGVAIVPTQTLADGINLSLRLNATDGDLPAQLLSFALIDGPGGVAVSNVGQVTWNPSPAQRPGSYRIRFSVGDGVAFVTNEFPVILLPVGAVGSAPSVAMQPWDQSHHVVLRIRGETGAALLLESAEVIGSWTEERRVTGQGNDAPIDVELILDSGARSKFWRVRTLP